MTIQEQILQDISQAFQAAYNHPVEPSSLLLQPTRKDFTGNYTFVMFPFSKITKASPEQGAAKIGEYLKANSAVVKEYNVVKGFLNISVEDRTWLEIFDHIVHDKKYRHFLLNGKNVMVEYSSTNTNKPLHLGHRRNNFLGFSIPEMLNANGFDFIRTNLANDRGIHI